MRKDLPTTLHGCVEQNDFNSLSWLLSQGACVNQVNSESETALHIAIGYSRKKCVVELLKFGIDTRIEDHFGWTARDWAQQYRPQPLYHFMELIDRYEGRCRQITNKIYTQNLAYRPQLQERGLLDCWLRRIFQPYHEKISPFFKNLYQRLAYYYCNALNAYYYLESRLPLSPDLSRRKTETVPSPLVISRKNVEMIRYSLVQHRPLNGRSLESLALKVLSTKLPSICRILISIKESQSDYMSAYSRKSLYFRISLPTEALENRRKIY